MSHLIIDIGDADQKAIPRYM